VPRTSSEVALPTARSRNLRLIIVFQELRQPGSCRTKHSSEQYQRNIPNIQVFFRLRQACRDFDIEQPNDWRITGAGHAEQFASI
jgi:hypothetical protein